MIGVVIIGRNEGERLRRCLSSVKRFNRQSVYVDSGSTDNSVSTARSLGFHVVDLDMTIPFSAARARNTGFEFLKENFAELEYIQFIDGDCSLDSRWIDASKEFLDKNRDYAIVAGRRREIQPESSIYNRLCDLEWDTPVGDTESSGGDFLVRIDAFGEVSGFNPVVIAGEEPDLCYRLRRRGWKIYRLDAEMTSHDAAITSFPQWWKRTMRAGHAYAQVRALHSNDRNGIFRKQTVKALGWGLLLPLGLIAASLVLNPLFLLGLLLYPARGMKIMLNESWRSSESRFIFLYAVFTILASIPQAFGVLLFYRRKAFHGDMKIIEYNSTSAGE